MLRNIKRTKNLTLKIFIAIFSSFLAVPVFGQNTETATSGGFSQSEMLLVVVLALVLVVAILVLVIALYMINILKIIILEDRKKAAVAAGKEYVPVEKASWWKKFMKSATDAVPIEEEESIMLDHDYDGIHELDNHLPPWWTALFYITIVWGIVYLLVYHVFDSFPLMHEEYQITMEQAEAEKAARMKLVENNIDETSVVFSDESQVLNSGKEIFLRECKACHGEQGQGLIGPNLTDNFWKHGGSINDIFTTIKYGVPEKGMISWQSKLSPTDMRDVASFIVTLHGTNPPNAKAPEGEEYIPQVQEETGAADSLGTAPNDGEVVTPEEQTQTDTLKVVMN